MRYALITGSGRSGTNWLLSTLDASPWTHCRNEPHGVVGTPMNAFPLEWTSRTPVARSFYAAGWDRVAAHTAHRYGERDHDMRYPKQHLWPLTNRLGLSRLMTSARPRSVLGHLDRRLASPEWPLPVWLGSRRRLEDSVGVLKILADRSLLSWLIAERPEVKVVHAIRHPGGRLHSWLGRLLGPMDAQQREGQRTRRVEHLENVRRHDPIWREIIPDPTTLSLVDLELWFWRYLNETTLTATRGQPGCLMVQFERLADDPVGWARRVFEHMEVPWDAVVEERVQADTTRSVFGPVEDPRAVARAWRTKLAREHVEAIDRVLAGSPLLGLLEGS